MFWSWVYGFTNITLDHEQSWSPGSSYSEDWRPTDSAFSTERPKQRSQMPHSVLHCIGINSLTLSDSCISTELLLEPVGRHPVHSKTRWVSLELLLCCVVDALTRYTTSTAKKLAVVWFTRCADVKARAGGGLFAMPPRRSHRKSRLGCLQCKRRKIKVGLPLPFTSKGGSYLLKMKALL